MRARTVAGTLLGSEMNCTSLRTSNKEWSRFTCSWLNLLSYRCVLRIKTDQTCQDNIKQQHKNVPLQSGIVLIYRSKVTRVDVFNLIRPCYSSIILFELLTFIKGPLSMLTYKFCVSLEVNSVLMSFLQTCSSLVKDSSISARTASYCTRNFHPCRGKHFRHFTVSKLQKVLKVHKSLKNLNCDSRG